MKRLSGRLHCIFMITGIVLLLNAQTLAAQEETPETQLTNLEYVQDLFKTLPHDYQLDIVILEGKEDFVEGETVSFMIRSSKDTHVVLLNHQVDGSAVILFPNEWDQETFIEANKTYFIPNLDKGQDYTPYVVPPFGVDVVQLVACTQPNAFHDLVLEAVKRTRAENPFGTVTRSLLTRGLDLAISSPERSTSSPVTPAEWSEAHILITTHPEQ